MKTLLAVLATALFFCAIGAWQQEYYEGRLEAQAKKHRGSGDWGLEVEPGLFDNGVRFVNGAWKAIIPEDDNWQWVYVGGKQ